MYNFTEACLRALRKDHLPQNKECAICGHVPLWGDKEYAFKTLKEIGFTWMPEAYEEYEKEE